MAQFQIVCTERQAYHEHITHVGTGNAAKADARWTVQEVRFAIENGDVFYTVGPRSNEVALVEPYDAYANGVVIETLRSSPDAVADNNLDNLRVCRFTS